MRIFLSSVRLPPPACDGASVVDSARTRPYMRRLLFPGSRLGPRRVRSQVMKVRSSIKSLKTRHRDCKVVRRKGVVYVINKTNPRFKAKQG